MAGKQAKTLTRQQVRAALHRARRSRYPQLAGHRSIEQTQAYIDASARAKRRLIALL